MTSQFDQARARPRLRDRAFAAGAWTIGSYGVDLVVRLFSNLILARLLFPEAFAAIAAAMALITGLALISDFGVQAAIIRSASGEEPGFLRSAWTFQLSRGAALWLLVVVLCVLIGLPGIRGLFPTESIFADHNLPVITAVLGLAMLVGGAESTATALNVRHLNYRPLVIINLISKIGSVAVTLTWACLAPGVWALVGGTLASSFIRVVLSHIMVPGPHMGLNWERNHITEIARFGRWIAISSFANFISQQSDIILLGTVLPASVLGMYSIAKLLATIGEGFLDRINGALAMSIFGEVIRQDPSVFRNRYYRFRLPTDLVAGLMSGGLFAAADFIVNFLYDTRYSEAGPMLQILALGTLSYPFMIISDAFSATGDSHIYALGSILKAIALAAFLVIGFFTFGLPGAIAGIAFHRFIPSIVILTLANRRAWFWFWHELRIIPAFIVGLLLERAACLLLTNSELKISISCFLRSCTLSRDPKLGGQLAAILENVGNVYTSGQLN